jgi:hypothetical protein
LELQFDVQPWNLMVVRGWFAYNDADLTKGYPADSGTYGMSGDQLPYGSRYSANLSAHQGFPLGENWNGYFMAQAEYLSERLGAFTPTSERQKFPGYTQIDVSAGATRDLWTGTFYITNVSNQLGQMVGVFVAPTTLQYIQPRTIGISLSRQF